MANTVSHGNRLRKTYKPVNVVSARRFDQARAKGAKLLEQAGDKTISPTPREVLLGKVNQVDPAKPLKRWRERRGSNPRPPP
jgi:hypothetical protein